MELLLLKRIYITGIIPTFVARNEVTPLLRAQLKMRLSASVDVNKEIKLGVRVLRGLDVTRTGCSPH